jgi:hypothetical protein
MILGNASSHVVSSAKVGKSHGFSTLELSNMTFIFLPPNVASKIKPLDQDIIASFKIQYKKKLCGGFCHNMMVPNIRQAIMLSYEVWSKLDAQIVNNCWRMARMLPATWNVDFALIDERKKNIMREV